MSGNWGLLRSAIPVRLVRHVASGGERATMRGLRGGILTLDNNILSILSYASTQATWTAASTLARECGIPFPTIQDYLQGRYWHEYGYDYFGQVASHFRYDYRIRRRLRTYYISAVSRGYA